MYGTPRSGRRQTIAEIGYTMICEQRSPKDLVQDAVHAERAGFDFSVISDHFHIVPSAVTFWGVADG